MVKRSVIFYLCILLIIGGVLLIIMQKKTVKNQAAAPITKTCSNFIVVTPKQGQKITSPMTISAIVDNTKSKSCHWTVFEAQAGTMQLTDSKGETIGKGMLTTTSEWMTDKAVTYSGTITLTKPPAGSEITLTITEEVPSGKGRKVINIPLTY